MTLSRLNNSPIRQYKPTKGTRITLAEFQHYGIVAQQHPEHNLSVWSNFTVHYITEDSVYVEHYNAGNTGVCYFVPLVWISIPIGWHPRYTIHCKAEQAQTIINDWFTRGIVVRQSHDMSGSMPTAFQPLTDDALPSSPHWQFPEDTDVIPAEDCARVFRVVAVEQEEITSAVLGYPADPNCHMCKGTGRRTVAELAIVRQETLAQTWDGINTGKIPLDNLTSTDFRCHCAQYGAMTRMGRTKRAKLVKRMRADGWKVAYRPYAGGYWERSRETVVHDRQESR
jgi:hypothetical protein